MDMRSVFQTGDQLTVGYAKDLLEANAIEFVIRNEQLQNLLGVGVVGAGYNPIVSPIEILVREEDAVRALEVLHDLI